MSKITTDRVLIAAHCERTLFSHDNFSFWNKQGRCVYLTYSGDVLLFKLYRHDVGLVATSPHIDGIVAAYNALVEWVDE